MSWVTKYGFKGVSLDWEFGRPTFNPLPVSRELNQWKCVVGKQGSGNNIVSPSDSTNYLAFLAKVRQTLGTAYIISAAVPVTGCVI